MPPGRYTVRLTVDGAAQTAPLTVRMDPRVKTTPAGLTQQHATSRAIDAALRRVAAALNIGMRYEPGAVARALRDFLPVLRETAAAIERDTPSTWLPAVRP